MSQKFDVRLKWLKNLSKYLLHCGVITLISMNPFKGVSEGFKYKLHGWLVSLKIPMEQIS